MLEVSQISTVLLLHPLAPSLYLAQPLWSASIGTPTKPSVHHLHVQIPSLPPNREEGLLLLPSLNFNLGCHDRDSKVCNFCAIIQNKRTYLLVPFCMLDCLSLSNSERLIEWNCSQDRLFTIILCHLHCTHHAFTSLDRLLLHRQCLEL